MFDSDKKKGPEFDSDKKKASFLISTTKRLQVDFDKEKSSSLISTRKKVLSLISRRTMPWVAFQEEHKALSLISVRKSR